MITIDPTLPANLLPLTWLIGHWQGYGANLESGQPRMMLEDITVVRQDQELLVTAQLWDAQGPQLPPETPVRQGVSQLVRADLIKQERTRVTVTIRHEAREGQPAQLLLEGDSENGKWVGLAEGPRLQLQSVHDQQSQSSKGMLRMAGLVRNELMWTHGEYPVKRLTSAGGVRDDDVEVTLTGRLIQVEERPLFNAVK